MRIVDLFVCSVCVLYICLCLERFSLYALFIFPDWISYRRNSYLYNRIDLENLFNGCFEPRFNESRSISLALTVPSLSLFHTGCTLLRWPNRVRFPISIMLALLLMSTPLHTHTHIHTGSQPTYAIADRDNSKHHYGVFVPSTQSRGLYLLEISL